MECHDHIAICPFFKIPPTHHYTLPLVNGIFSFLGTGGLSEPFWEPSKGAHGAEYRRSHPPDTSMWALLEPHCDRRAPAQARVQGIGSNTCTCRKAVVLFTILPYTASMPHPPRPLQATPQPPGSQARQVLRGGVCEDARRGPQRQRAVWSHIETGQPEPLFVPQKSLLLLHGLPPRPSPLLDYEPRHAPPPARRPWRSSWRHTRLR